MCYLQNDRCGGGGLNLCRHCFRVRQATAAGACQHLFDSPRCAARVSGTVFSLLVRRRPCDGCLPTLLAIGATPCECGCDAVMRRSSRGQQVFRVDGGKVCVQLYLAVSSSIQHPPPSLEQAPVPHHRCFSLFFLLLFLLFLLFLLSLPPARPISQQTPRFFNVKPCPRRRGTCKRARQQRRQEGGQHAPVTPAIVIARRLAPGRPPCSVGGGVWAGRGARLAGR